MSKTKEIVMPVVVLGLVCLIVTSLLAVTNYFTAPIIAQAAVEKANESRRVVLPEGDSFTQVVYEGMAMSELGISEIYQADNGAGYAVTAVASGYGGDISVMFGIDNEGAIVGVEVLEHGETQGLGDRIATVDFKGQFIGKSGSLNLVKGSASGENDIVALTGATISSTAMTNAANCALEAVNLVKGAQ